LSGRTTIIFFYKEIENLLLTLSGCRVQDRISIIVYFLQNLITNSSTKHITSKHMARLWKEVLEAEIEKLGVAMMDKFRFVVFAIFDSFILHHVHGLDLI